MNPRPNRPMLATPSTGTSNRAPIDIHDLAGTHAFDVKLDGVRAFAHWDGNALTLSNRNGIDITHKYPEIVQEAHGLGHQPLWLDGEIMAEDGRFESVLTRDKTEQPAAILERSLTIPTRFFAFDVPAFHALEWTERRELLLTFADDWVTEKFQTTVCSEDPKFLQQTASLGLEGVIAKLKTASYQFGARSKAWVKFKNLHRVTCLVTGYAAGTGAREHFGAMFLALLDEDGEVVPCGRVGTGFTGSEINDLKARLDRKEVLTVEIECLNRTSGGTLRFPVYKGIRTDVDVIACSTEQLTHLPAC